MRSALLLITATATVGLTVTGCEASFSLGGSTLDNEKLEKELAQKFSNATVPASEIHITCPDDVKTDAGTTFTCDMTVRGDKRLVFVTLEEDQRYEALASLDARGLERELTQELSEQAGADPTKVSTACPDGIRPAKGRKLTCTLTAPDGSKVKVDVTLTNERGGYRAYVPPDQFG